MGKFHGLPDTWIVETSFVPEVEKRLWEVDEASRVFTRKIGGSDNVRGIGWEILPLDPAGHELTVRRRESLATDYSIVSTTKLVRDGSYVMSEFVSRQADFPTDHPYYDVDNEEEVNQWFEIRNAEFESEVSRRYEEAAAECVAWGFPRPKCIVVDETGYTTEEKERRE